MLRFLWYLQSSLDKCKSDLTALDVDGASDIEFATENILHQTNNWSCGPVEMRFSFSSK